MFIIIVIIIMVHSVHIRKLTMYQEAPPHVAGLFLCPASTSKIILQAIHNDIVNEDGR